MTTRSQRLRDRGWEDVDEEALESEQGVLELTSGEQLRALADGFRLRLLTAVGRQPGSAKELADRFGVPTTRLYHHLDLLEEHGFVTVVATRRSGARTERCYGTRRWRSIRPSPELVDAEDTSELASAMRAIAEVVGATLEAAVRTGALHMPTTDDDVGPHMVTWSTARLTPEQQQAFSEELTDLTGRIIAASTTNTEEEDPDAESVALYLVLAPDGLTPT